MEILDEQPMLNYNDNEQALQAFYGSSVLEPRTIADFTKVDDLRPPEDLDQLSTDEQCAVLVNFLKDADDAHTSAYRFGGEDLKDPLTGQDLVSLLLQKGVIGSENDQELTKYVVSSQSFNSQAYLSVVHKDTPMEQLVTSLDMLDKSIRSQTSQLKAVLNENYSSFVDCKKFIDEALVNFKNSKTRAQKESEKSRVFNPSSRWNKKLRVGESISSQLEESINNLNMSSSLMIRPIVEHNDKEAKLSRLIEFIQKNKFFFDLPKKLVDYLSLHNHDRFIDDYNTFLKEKEFIEHRREKALQKARSTNDEAEVKKVEQEYTLYFTVLLRAFLEIDTIAEEFRKKAFRDLLSMDHEVTVQGRSKKSALDIKFIDLVDKLHRLKNKANTNPIYEFLNEQLSKVKKDLSYQDDKFEAKFTMMQKKLLDYITSLANQREGGSNVRHIEEKFDSVEDYFGTSSSIKTMNIDEAKETVIVEMFSSADNLDLSIINETWLVLVNYIKYLEEFFSNVVLKFVKNYVHYADPQSGFTIDENGILRDAFFQLCTDMVAHVVSIFDCEAEVDQIRVTPANYPNFLPPHANSLSTIFHLTDINTRISRLLIHVSTYVAQVGNVSKSFDTNKHIKHLKESSSLVEQRILEAICATWVNDCSQFYDLENWEMYRVEGNHKSTVYTKLMQIMQYYERYVLRKLAALVFDRSDLPQSEYRVVSAYPSKRTLVSLEIQFMRSINVLMDSIMKKFTATKSKYNNPQDFERHDIDNDIFKIMTMNNFQVLGEVMFPSLIKRFDQLFNKDLHKQNLKLYADLDKVIITVLDEISDNEKSWIEKRIMVHFESLDRKLSNDTFQVDPFVYECLMHFVKLVHVFKPITAELTFNNLIHELQNHFLKQLTRAIREVKEKQHIIVRILGNLRLDLDYFIDVFESSDSLRLDDYSLSLGRVAVKEIKECERIFKDLDYTDDDIESALNKAVEHSQKEFSCFI